jgi:hypothetical protein
VARKPEPSQPTKWTIYKLAAKAADIKLRLDPLALGNITGNLLSRRFSRPHPMIGEAVSDASFLRH